MGHRQIIRGLENQLADPAFVATDQFFDTSPRGQHHHLGQQHVKLLAAGRRLFQCANDAQKVVGHLFGHYLEIAQVEHALGCFMQFAQKARGNHVVRTRQSGPHFFGLVGAKILRLEETQPTDRAE